MIGLSIPAVVLGWRKDQGVLLRGTARPSIHPEDGWLSHDRSDRFAAALGRAVSA